MRIGIVRTDIQKIYLSDVENSSQRDFSSQPNGQSRYFSHPADAALVAILNTYALTTLLGTNASTFDTTGSNGTKLNIRTKTTDAYKQVTVRSGATVTAAQIVADLNLAFKNGNIAATARVSGTHVAIDSSVGGPGVSLSLSASSPSTATLQTVLGLSTVAVVGLSLAALKAAVYTGGSIDVSSATLLALSSFASMSAAEQTALVGAVQVAVAPRLVETGPVLLSFVDGVISQLVKPTFQPGGSRGGLVAGKAAVVLADDGVSIFSL
jgi:hypothetical protein